ncbi:MAG: STAS domain-containing protein [Solirubrobacteraceae bacterium]
MRVGQVAGAVVISPAGELDLATADELREQLVRQPGGCRLLLDLRGLTFMDSSGLALVAEQQRRAERDGIDFRLVRTSGPVQELFEITGLAKHLRWEDDIPGGSRVGEAGPR